jgi:hypothetical protein
MHHPLMNIEQQFENPYECNQIMNEPMIDVHAKHTHGHFILCSPHKCLEMKVKINVGF